MHPCAPSRYPLRKETSPGEQGLLAFPAVAGGAGVNLLNIVVLSKQGAVCFLRRRRCAASPCLFSANPLNVIYFVVNNELKSPEFAPGLASCGQAEHLHFIGVLPFDDEFREEIVLDGIQEKFGQALA